VVEEGVREGYGVGWPGVEPRLRTNGSGRGREISAAVVTGPEVAVPGRGAPERDSRIRTAE
jgi:hypothetical protein